MAYLEDLFNLKGKTALITGGTGVLGSKMAESLAFCGVKTAILGRDRKKADEIVSKIRNENGTAISLTADVTDEEQIKRAVNEFLDEYGNIDILINAAGGNMPGATIGPDQPVTELDPDALKKIIDLNYFGTVYATQASLPHMISQGSGSIINISSMAAGRPLTRIMGYSSSKAAIDNYTQWLAVELARKESPGIRVNAIAPGFFVTYQNEAILKNKDGSLTSRGESIMKNTPMGRFGNPEDLTGVTLWLAGDASKFVTGTVIKVDGGFSAFSGV